MAQGIWSPLLLETPLMNVVIKHPPSCYPEIWLAKIEHMECWVLMNMKSEIDVRTVGLFKRIQSNVFFFLLEFAYLETSPTTGGQRLHGAGLRCSESLKLPMLVIFCNQGFICRASERCMIVCPLPDVFLKSVTSLMATFKNFSHVQGSIQEIFLRCWE